MQKKQDGLDKLEILQLNGYIKFVEFILASYQNEPEETTLKQIKDSFQETFRFRDFTPLNQNFAIFRLIPLLQIREHYKGTEGEPNKSIKIIRHALAHGNFELKKEGITFNADAGKKMFTYDEFNEFVYKIENEFYKK